MAGTLATKTEKEVSITLSRNAACVKVITRKFLGHKLKPVLPSRGNIHPSYSLEIIARGSFTPSR